MRSPVRSALSVLVAVIAIGCGGTSQSGGSSGASGVSGSADVGGSNNLGGSANGGANSCALSGTGFGLSLSVVGAIDQGYEGPALVEQSMADGVVLYFGGAAAPDTTATHATIRGLSPMPTIPPGATLWLRWSGYNAPPTFSPFQGDSHSAWAFGVFDREGGRLLFGGSLDGSTLPAAPLATGAITPACVAPNPVCPSNRTAQVTYEAVEVQGDSPVTLRDGEVGSVELGGFAYQVGVSAQAPSAGTGGCAPDYFPHSYLSVSVQAKDLAELARALAPGDLPSCIPGTHPAENIGMVMSEWPVDMAFDGKVTYLRRDQLTAGFWFGTGVTYDGAAVELNITGAGDILPEPKVGSDFWATLPDWSFSALRSGRGGPLLLLHATQSLPPAPGGWSMLESALGVSVSIEERCKYAATSPLGGAPVSLWDVVLGGDPPVRLHQGELGAFRVGDQNYAVWFDAGSEIDLVLHTQ